MAQSFYIALFDKNIESADHAKTILALSFLICSVFLFLIITLQLAAPETFNEKIGTGPEILIFAYSYGLTLLGLGWFIYKRHLWATYISIIVWIGPNVLDAIIERTFPSIHFTDGIFVVFMIASMRSIKRLRNESA